MNPTPSEAPFKDQDHSGIINVRQLQYALLQDGLDPFNHIIWDEQRHTVATYGVYVVTLLEDGTYSLDIRDRGDVNHRGTYDTEADLVRAYLAEANPRRPPDQARVRAAARRDYVENRAELARMKEEDRQRVAHVLRERAEAGLPLDPTTE